MAELATLLVVALAALALVAVPAGGPRSVTGSVYLALGAAAALTADRRR